ncbi:hypothetical protein [Burkholderia ubonensis]|uniref:hypothetical protein n=1 Tax=Burkholderia ubonensis TaxID=101571 RepID=UPI000F57B53C|nr:hypothetical protein [Burkholderia ubonensis]
MKNQTDTAGSPSRSAEGQVDWGAVIRAKQAARKLREVFDRLSPVERVIASAYIAMVRELVEQVEQL